MKISGLGSQLRSSAHWWAHYRVSHTSADHGHMNEPQGPEEGHASDHRIQPFILLTKPPSLSSPLLINTWLVTLVTHGIVFQISLISNSTINNPNHRNVQYPTSSSTVVGAVEMAQLLGALAAWKMHGGLLCQFPGERCCRMSSMFPNHMPLFQCLPLLMAGHTHTVRFETINMCAYTHTCALKFETVYITQAAVIQVVRL